ESASFRRAEAARAAGLHGAVAIPVEIGSRLVGVVEWFSCAIRPPEADMIEVLGGLGSQIGQFLERKRAEAALQASERRYRRIVDTASEGIWTVDPEFRIDYVNARLVQMLGCAGSDIVGRSPLEFMFAEDLDGTRAQVEARLAEEHSETEFRLRRKDGSELWVLNSSSPILNEEGAFLGALGMLTDITERKRAGEALRESEERYRRIVDTANEGIWTVDPHLRIDYINARLVDMLGYPVEEMLGRSPLDYAFELDRVEHDQLYERLRRGSSEQVSCRLR